MFPVKELTRICCGLLSKFNQLFLCSIVYPFFIFHAKSIHNFFLLNYLLTKSRQTKTCRNITPAMHASVTELMSWATDSRYVGGGRKNLKKTVVDDVTTVLQRRLKDDARSVDPQMYQQHLLRYELQTVVFVTEVVTALSKTQPNHAGWTTNVRYKVDTLLSRSRAITD